MELEYILETQGLTKVYGNKEAAKDVNLHIREGQIYGLIGPNGAGKTTVMRMISGLSAPSRGSYTICGKGGRELGRMLRNIGVLIEQPGLYPKLSAYENLKIKCLGVGMQPQGYVEEVLKTVGLDPTERGKACGTYSLGMRQRLGIALALTGNPKMLVLDEPINGLDPQGIVEIREMLERLRDERGITIMVSSHILEELGKIADAYGIMRNGELIEEITAEELLERSGQYVVIRAGDPGAALSALKAAGIQGAKMERDGTLRIGGQTERTAEMAKAIVNAGVSLQEIYCRNLSLEDYYLGVTGGQQHA